MVHICYLHGLDKGYCFPYQTYTWSLFFLHCHICGILLSSIHSPHHLLWEWQRTAPKQNMYHFDSGPGLWDFFVFFIKFQRIPIRFGYADI